MGGKCPIETTTADVITTSARKRRSGGLTFRRGSAGVPADGPGLRQGAGSVGRNRRDRTVEVKRCEDPALMIRAEMAGHAIVVAVGEVGRPVARNMRPGVGAASLVLRRPALLTTVVVPPLDQHRGQDVERDEPRPGYTHSKSPTRSQISIQYVAFLETGAAFILRHDSAPCQAVSPARPS
jgi:hypothetical protein